jgi:hypothetical protein
MRRISAMVDLRKFNIFFPPSPLICVSARKIADDSSKVGVIEEKRLFGITAAPVKDAIKLLLEKIIFAFCFIIVSFYLPGFMLVLDRDG